MKHIELTNGGSVIVDDEDFEAIRKYPWRKQQSQRSDTLAYAVYTEPIEPRKTVRMHRVILGANSEDYVDHISGDGLDNRRSNLRICSHKDNCRNRRKRSDCKSKYKGVKKHYQRGEDTGKWMARICTDEGRKYLGLFNSEDLAAVAYNEAAVKYHGEYAKLNSIPRI